MNTPPKERGILFSSEMVRATLDGRKTETRRVMRPQPSNEVDWESFGYSGLTPENYIEGRGRFPVKYFQEEHRDALKKWNLSGKQYGSKFFKSPYGKPGDILYVRETFSVDNYPEIEYRADCDEIHCHAYKWKPSIHMPKKFSRIKLKIKEIRVERVQEITMRSAIDEGSLCVDTELVVPGYLERTRIAGLRDENPPIGPNAIERFKYLWDSLNKKRGFGWDVNPYCWIIKFERLK